MFSPGDIETQTAHTAVHDMVTSSFGECTCCCVAVRRAAKHAAATAAVAVAAQACCHVPKCMATAAEQKKAR